MVGQDDGCPDPSSTPHVIFSVNHRDFYGLCVFPPLVPSTIPIAPGSPHVIIQTPPESRTSRVGYFLDCLARGWVFSDLLAFAGQLTFFS
jgi:hypothetical protein